MGERATERERLRTTDEVVYETVLNFLRQRVDHHRRMAEMMQEPFKSDHQELAEAFQAERDSLRSPSDRGGDSLALAIRMMRALKRDAGRDGDIPRLQLRLREVTESLEKLQDARAASTDAPSEEPKRDMTANDLLALGQSVYDGLTDEEIREVERAAGVKVTRADRAPTDEAP